MQDDTHRWYTSRVWKQQNGLFSNNEKLFYRQLNNMTQNQRSNDTPNEIDFMKH